jgi:hypothetical protein
MGDAIDPGAACWRIEIGVEDTAAAGELELEASAFAHLEAGATEPLDQFLGG